MMAGPSMTSPGAWRARYKPASRHGRRCTSAPCARHQAGARRGAGSTASAGASDGRRLHRHRLDDQRAPASGRNSAAVGRLELRLHASAVSNSTISAVSVPS
jgi:hypothetical protein